MEMNDFDRLMWAPSIDATLTKARKATIATIINLLYEKKVKECNVKTDEIYKLWAFALKYKNKTDPDSVRINEGIMRKFDEHEEKFLRLISQTEAIEKMVTAIHNYHKDTPVDENDPDWRNLLPKIGICQKTRQYLDAAKTAIKGNY